MQDRKTQANSSATTHSKAGVQNTARQEWPSLRRVSKKSRWTLLKWKPRNRLGGFIGVFCLVSFVWWLFFLHQQKMKNSLLLQNGTEVSVHYYLE